MCSTNRAFHVTKEATCFCHFSFPSQVSADPKIEVSRRSLNPVARVQAGGQ